MSLDAPAPALGPSTPATRGAGPAAVPWTPLSQATYRSSSQVQVAAKKIAKQFYPVIFVHSELIELNVFFVSERIDFLEPVRPAKVSVLTSIIKLGLKTLLECVRFVIDCDI